MNRTRVRRDEIILRKSRDILPYYSSQTLLEIARTFNKIEQSIYTPLAELTVEAWITPEPVTFAERELGEYKSLVIGQSWGKLWDCAWLRFRGRVPASARGKSVVLLIDLSGEACIVDHEGCPLLGLTTVSSEFDLSLGRPGKRVVPLSREAQGNERVDLWADAACNDLFGKYQDSGTLKEAQVALCDEEMFQLYHDFAVLHELMLQLPVEKARHQRILTALRQASNVMAAYTTEEARQARVLLAPELAKTGGSPSLTVSAIGHAHIDLAWLWPLRETIRKGARTFSTVLANMEQYPDYIFGASQPQLYQWMKDYYPPLYKKMQARIAEGRWETQGAMWVEPDTNLASGEALVRQIVYGKRFYREEFGTDPRMLWLPDVFGYSAALPQILKKAGVDYFLTIKISWNTINLFPHHTFFWQGIDGSQVLSHMPPEGTYNSSAAPRAIAAIETNFADKAVSEHAVLLYGIGDGGGGPGSEHLERLKREKNLDGLAPVQQEHMETFFERIAQESSEYKTWSGELYLEKHQGTYTTQARNKRFNRKMELSLRDLEFIATLASTLTGHLYPRQELDAIWKEVLLYQFHDILPGSSITRVYGESLARYQQLLEQTQHLILVAQSALLEPGTDNQTVTIFNSLSWERSTWLAIQDQWYYVTLPPMGYTTLDLSTQTVYDAEIQRLDVASPDTNSLENDILSIQFAADGAIESIFDKEHQRDVLASGAQANKLAVYLDDGDAWDFSIAYAERAPEYFVLARTAACTDGPQRIVEQDYTFGQSTLKQRIVLTAGSRRIDFITSVDWRENHKMLRTSFPVSVRSTEATCDIQFGTVKRPTHSNTSWDMAKYEICAHKWIDLSQWDYGVALLNDCKYGHKVAENILDLNLLRSPSYPDPQADRAEHEFTYALYPHAGNHIVGNVIRAGYELNVAPRISAGSVSKGGGRYIHSEAENIIIEAMKKAEGSDDMILRLYEATGASTTSVITFDMEIANIWQTNLLEEHPEPIEIKGRSIALTFKPYEIQTIRIHL